MAQEYRYPLTRVCLRGGAMTLPRTMIGLFPGDGSVVMVDTLTDTEHSVYMNHPRVVAGLGPLFREHGLEVNDELVIVPLGGIRFSVTPVLRSAAHEVSEDTANAEIVEAQRAGPAHEAAGSDHAGGSDQSDVTAVHAQADQDRHGEPSEQAGYESHEAASVRADYSPHEGSSAQVDTDLHERSSTEVDADLHQPGSAQVGTDLPELSSDQADYDLSESTTAQVDSLPEVSPREAAGTRGPVTSPDAAAQAAAASTGLDPRHAVREAESALAELESQRAGALKNGEPSQGTLWGTESGDEDPSGSVPASPGAGAATDQQHESPAASGSQATDAPGSVSGDGGVAEQRKPARGEERVRTPGRGAAFEEEDNNDATLAAVALTSRVRRVFSPLGFRIEPLAAGVAYLHAEMGRRRYKVLVQTLRSGERLDWAGLLSRRRNSPANYLAVMGDRADLIRLSNPANLARATLWSWEALSRLEEMHGSVPVTPLDLESHFERDGLFEQGLKRFEQGVAARIAERGAASEVLTRLARLKAPAVFLLEELAQDVSLSREAVLRILDRFAEAPMNLVARVDSGEFLLRQPVDAALASLAAYAESLRQRLPTTRREVIAGLDDDYDAAPEDQLLDDSTEASSNT